MSNLPYKIHEHLTARRRRPVSPNLISPKISEKAEDGPLPAKSYLRMAQIPLPTPVNRADNLHEILSRRKSSHVTTEEPLPLATVGSIFYALSLNDRGSRRYPSGGAKYPIETYLLAQRIDGLKRGAYHYQPQSHNLEHLWALPDELNLFANINGWAEKARGVIVFTAGWWKNNEKYQDFGYLLGMLETGHAAQNIILAATALNVPTCPLAGFNDDVASSLLDLDQNIEQPVYVVTLN